MEAAGAVVRNGVLDLDQSPQALRLDGLTKVEGLMPHRLLLASVVFLIGAGCATTNSPARIAYTPTGSPEALFLQTDSAALADVLASGCVNAGHRVLLQEEEQVVCGSAPSTLGQSAHAADVFRGKDVDAPEFRVRFRSSQEGADVHVVASMWLEGVTSSGQTLTEPLENTPTHNNIQLGLYQMGGRDVEGTRRIHMTFGPWADENLPPWAR